LSRLKERRARLRRRGQSGNQPLWNLNTVSKLWITLVRCGVVDLTSWKYLRKVRYPVLGQDNVPESAGMGVQAVI
jgi:hypothetical protein